MRRAALCGLFLLGVAIGTVASLQHQQIWPHVPWKQERLHSAIESLGAIAAISMAFVLISRRRNRSTHFWLAAGFLGMGIADFFHAACADPQGLVLLHVCSCLLCASGYILARYPAPSYRQRRRLLQFLVTFCTMFGMLVLLATELWPNRILRGGEEVAILFRVISVLAGTLFLVGSIKFIASYVRTGNPESLLFLCLALLFALADFAFSGSELWCQEWWSWHLVRLAGFSLAFGYVIRRYLINVTDVRVALIAQRRVEKALKKRSADLAERVKELDSLHRLHKLTERPEFDLEDIFLGLLEILTETFVGSGTACARIVYDGTEFRTPNYRETEWKMAKPIHCCQEPIGYVEVCYLERKRNDRGALFLPEEHRLLESVCDHMSETIQRKRLEKEVARVSVWERQRFGQELHDDLCQDLTGLGYLAGCLCSDLKDQSSDSAKRAGVLANGLQLAKNKTRVIAKGQALAEINAQDFVPSVQEVAELAQDRWGIPCHVHSGCDVRIENEETANQLLRITQEAIYNAEKHSDARQIHVHIDTTGRILTVRISDDGKGMPDQSPGGQKGIGMHIMRHRAHAICATLAVHDEKPTGTAVTCTVRLWCKSGKALSPTPGCQVNRCSQPEQPRLGESSRPSC